LLTGGRSAAFFVVNQPEVPVPNPSNVAEVDAIKDRIDGSVAALLTEYRGLKVGDLQELRRSLRASGTEYKVQKNTLVGIAVKEKGYEALVEMLAGPTAVAFVRAEGGDPVAAAKSLAEFARSHPALIVKGGLLEGRVLDADGVKQLATLESREALLARIAGLLQAQLQSGVNVLAAPLRAVATMTAALRDKRAAEEGGSAEAGEAESGPDESAG
jgi:large subunit ribosomal protein L10